MISVAVFKERRVALAFSDYLKAIGISNELEKVADEFSINLHNVNDFDRAQAELDHFLANPSEAKYWQASWQSGSVQKESVYEPADFNDVHQDAQGLGFWERVGPVTIVVAVLCIAIYLAFKVNTEVTFSWLHFPEMLSVEGIDGQWWRILTPAVMHFFFIHLLFNLMWWWDLGGLVEKMQSSMQLLAVTLTIMLISNIAQYVSYGPGFMGLSGVVYGLLGYVWLYPKANPAIGFRIRKEIVWFMLGWLLLGYTGLLDGFIGPVSNTGHASGLLVGGCLGLAFGFLHRGKSKQEPAI